MVKETFSTQKDAGGLEKNFLLAQVGYLVTMKMQSIVRMTSGVLGSIGSIGPMRRICGVGGMTKSFQSNGSVRHYYVVNHQFQYIILTAIFTVF